MGAVLSRFGVWNTAHSVAGIGVLGLFLASGEKAALTGFVAYFFGQRWVKKKLTDGGVIRLPPEGPLKGIVVLDLSMVLSGPLAGAILSQVGAQVINIESGSQPDSARVLGTAAVRGMSGCFAASGRGKQSIQLDLKLEAGKQAFFDLVSRADVVIQNFRPGAVERMGISYDDCVKINPEIIYLSSSGFGEEGPYKHLRVYDPIIQCVAGMPHPQGGSYPELVGQAVIDKLTSMKSAQAIIAALRHRALGHGGQHVKTDMLSVALQSVWPELNQFQTFLGDCDSDEIGDYKQLYDADKPVKINPIREAIHDVPFGTAKHILFGECRVAELPIEFSKTPVSRREASVLIGEHTRKVLRELGYSSGKIDSMLAENSATSTESLILMAQKGQEKAGDIKGAKGSGKKAFVFRMLEKLQQGHTFNSKKDTSVLPRKELEKTETVTSGVMDKLKVVDITTGIAGATCTQALADQGSTVIKVEFENELDPVRSLGPNGSKKYSAMFASLNRQKLSIVLKREEKEGMLEKLLKWADVVLIDESTERAHGVDYSLACKLNPKVIYTVIESFDEIQLQGLTGACDAQAGEIDDGSDPIGPPPYFAERKYGKERGSKMQPSFVCVSIFAKAIGLYACIGITAALYAQNTRLYGNKGQKLTINSREAGCHFTMPDVHWNQVWPKGTFMPDFPELSEAYAILKLGCGKEVFTISLSNREWEDARAGFIDEAVKGSEWEEFVQDETINASPVGRINQTGKLYQMMHFAASKTDYVTLQKAKGVLLGPVNKPETILDDPHIKMGNYLIELEHPVLGRHRTTQPPVSFNLANSSVRRSASLPNEDRDTILKLIMMN